jgi:hypothetical protein
MYVLYKKDCQCVGLPQCLCVCVRVHFLQMHGLGGPNVAAADKIMLGLNDARRGFLGQCAASCHAASMIILD